MRAISVLLFLALDVMGAPQAGVTSDAVGGSDRCATVQVSHRDEEVMAAVLRAAVADAHFWQSARIDRYVLSDCTLPAPELQLAKPLLVKRANGGAATVTPDRRLLKELVRRNRLPARVRLTKLDTRLQLADGAVLGQIFEREGTSGWATFRRQFPLAAGIIRVGLPAYSPDGSTALMFVSRSRGDLEGEDSLVSVVRRGKTWAVVWYAVVLMS